MKNWLKQNWLYLLILTALVLITYGNSLNNAFLSDDIAEIRDNPKVADLGYAISSHPFGFIRLIFYWLAYHLGGLNPLFFRLINIIFHLGSVYLIYIILHLIHSKKLALVVASIFAIHPAISEAVVWISGGMYPQYTFFFLLSFLFYVFAQRKGKVLRASSIISQTASEEGPYILSSKKRFFYLLSSIFYLLSLMSHPAMPIALFLIYPLYEAAFGNFKKNWIKSIPYLILSIAYVVLNLISLPERETTLKSVHYQERGIDNPFILIPVAISSYFELIFWPKILTLYHSELAFGTVQFLIRSSLTLLFFAVTAISFFKNRQIFFWLSLFLIGLAPTLTPFRLNWIVAERYLYLPILGIIVPTILFLGYLVKKVRIKHLDVAVVLVIITLLAIRTIMRNIDWKNEDNLWIATGKTSPSSPNTHNNLGDVYGRQGDKQKALQEFQKAIELKPNYADAYHNLGNTYRELGEIDKALESYQMASRINPNLWQSYQNIAALYFEAKQYDLALENIQKAIQINPKNINLRVNLGIVYLVVGQKEKAKEIFNLILSIDPQNQIAKQGLIETQK